MIDWEHIRLVVFAYCCIFPKIIFDLIAFVHERQKTLRSRRPILYDMKSKYSKYQKENRTQFFPNTYPICALYTRIYCTLYIRTFISNMVRNRNSRMRIVFHVLYGVYII
jgi:hypothetical protein